MLTVEVIRFLADYWSTFASDFIAFPSRFIKTLCAIPQAIIDNAYPADLIVQCEESIHRLNCLPEQSAKQKGHLLKKLWSKIIAELVLIEARQPLEPATKERVVADLLQKEYIVIYQGYHVSLSFEKVAAMRRQDPDNFQLAMDRPNSYDFFYGYFFKTKSTKLIATSVVPMKALPTDQQAFSIEDHYRVVTKVEDEEVEKLVSELIAFS